jgi:PAS domain S-box-containing protein
MRLMDNSSRDVRHDLDRMTRLGGALVLRSAAPGTLCGTRREGRLSQEDLVIRLQEYHERLARSERKGPRWFEEAFADPPAGIAIHDYDANARITRVNSEELRILGYAPEQMVGHHVWEFVVMADASRQSIEKKLAGEKDIKPFVRTFRRSDGSGVAMLIVDRRILDAQGQPTGMRTAMTPVT